MVRMAEGVRLELTSPKAPVFKIDSTLSIAAHYHTIQHNGDWA